VGSIAQLTADDPGDLAGLKFELKSLSLIEESFLDSFFSPVASPSP